METLYPVLFASMGIAVLWVGWWIGKRLPADDEPNDDMHIHIG